MAGIGLTVVAASPSTANYTGAGSNYTVKTPGGVFYQVYIDVNVDVVWTKSTDGGATWSAPAAVFTGTATALSIWYDRWSNISAGLIHIAYQESANDDTLYRTLDTEGSDALSTETTILAGTSTLAGGALSICRARGGNVYCATMIDAGTEGGFMRLPTANVPNGAWDAARATVFEAATSDQIILMPGWAADNQDMMAFYWDSDADEISRKLYDDSADSWSESSIAASMVDAGVTSGAADFAAAVDITNSRNLLVAWSAQDLATADLRCWHVTESAITEVTNVVLNSSDDQGMCAIGIDTDTEDWYVFFFGLSDGSEVFRTAQTLCYKKSTDDGATWGAETRVYPRMASPTHLIMTPRFDTEKMVRMQATSTSLSVIYDVAAAAGGGLVAPLFGGGII